MNTFSLRIASPDGDIFNGECAFLKLRGIEGELAIMAGHIPFVTPVKSGNIKLIDGDGNEMTGLCESGILTVTKESVLFLTGKIDWNN